MAFQNDGWPLGLHGLNENHHIAIEGNVHGSSSVADSASFSSDSSSDLDTESTGSSFFYDKSITLGNLIGIPPEAGGVSTRVIHAEGNHGSSGASRRHKRNGRSKSWWGLCGSSNDGSGNKDGGMMPPSLGQFLEVERRAAASTRREKMYFNMVYDEFTAGSTMLDANPLFADGHILPPHSSTVDPYNFAGANGHGQGEGQPSWALADFFNEAPSRSSSVGHQRHHSIGSKVPTLLSGICGRTSIEA